MNLFHKLLCCTSTVASNIELEVIRFHNTRRGGVMAGMLMVDGGDGNLQKLKSAKGSIAMYMNTGFCAASKFCAR